MPAASAAPLIAAMASHHGGRAPSACAPALRAAACAWGAASVEGVSARLAFGRHVPEEPASSSAAPSVPRASGSSSPALLGRHQRRQLPLSLFGAGAQGTSARSPPWQPDAFRTFASAAQPQPEAHAAEAQPAGAAAGSGPAAGGSSQAPASTPTPPPAQQEGGGGPQARIRPPRDVVYLGPLSQQHKLLKRISIANTLVAAGAGPAIVHYADNISMVGRYGLAASLVFFGVITTGALHWVAHPYVHELKYTAATGKLDVRTTTLLGGSRWHTFDIDDVQPLPWSRPVATFVARNQFYYIDVYSFPDEDLLRRLTPDEADVPQGYKDKDEDDD